MRDIIMITPNGYDVEYIREMLPSDLDSNIDENDNMLSVAMPFDRRFVQFRVSNTIEKHYEGQEKAFILNTAGPSAQFFIVHFKIISDLTPILLKVANRSDFIIDNDNGLIERADEFIRKLVEFPDWDWAYKEYPEQE